MRQKNQGPLILEEKKTVNFMLDCYYKKHQETTITEAELRNYAMARLDVCRFGEEKPTCKQCPVHCYRPDYRQQMTQVMRYAGPRMMYLHPYLAYRHLKKEWINKKNK